MTDVGGHGHRGTGPVQPLVVVVHDEPAVLHLLSTVLTTRGWAVVEAGSVSAARKTLATLDQPAAVITDLQLPDGSGLDLLADARRRFGVTLPLALVTADYGAETEVRARAGDLTLVHVGILRLADMEDLVSRLLTTRIPVAR
jgi:CheY-like chemotaxis protein